MPKLQTCAACQFDQELPAIFCKSCGAPLIRISKFFLTSLLTITVAAYVLFGLYSQKLGWPAPLYLYYGLLFVIFSYTVTRRHPVMTLRMLAWSTILLYAMWFFWLRASLSGGLKMLTSDIRDVIDKIQSTTIGPWVVLGVAVLILVVAFAALWRRFGFVYGYRVFFTLLSGATFLARWAFAYSIGQTAAPVSPRLSDWFVWAPETTVQELLELISVNTLRVVFAEMAVYSFVASYKSGEEHYRKVVKPAVAPAGGPNVLFDAITRLSNAMLRAAIMVQYFAIFFGRTLGHYAWAMWRTIRRILVDAVIPAVSLCTVAFLLGLLAEHSAAYISGKPMDKLIFFHGFHQSWQMMFAVLFLTFIVQMIFLGCVTKFPLKALWRCNALLMLWIAPFFFAFVVFVSLSLVVTTGVLRRWDTNMVPYHFGPFSAICSAVLVVLILYAVVHNLRRRGTVPATVPAGAAPTPAPAATDQLVEEAEPADAQPESASGPAPTPVPDERGDAS